jgi:hypothetical protein
VFSINAVALNIGTTNIVFTYEDTSLTIEQQAIVSNCVDTLLEPALPFRSFSRFQDKVYLEFNIYGYPFNQKMFKKVSIENNTMMLPITKIFSTKILSSEVLRTKYADAISKLPEFWSTIKSLNIEQLTDSEVNMFFLIPEKFKEIITMELCVGRLKEMKKFIIYEIPIICYKEENAGPNNNLYLWAYVPYSFSDKIFGHITLIYYNDKWIFSSPRYYFNY